MTWKFSFYLRIKVHIFWEGHKILRNLHLTFDLHYVHRTIVRWRFRKFFLAFSECMNFTLFGTNFRKDAHLKHCLWNILHALVHKGVKKSFHLKQFWKVVLQWQFRWKNQISKGKGNKKISLGKDFFNTSKFKKYKSWNPIRRPLIGCWATDYWVLWEPIRAFQNNY